MDNFKDELIKDLISVCAITNLGEHTLHECLRLVFSWALTARDDDGNSAKYFGCPYWSHKALEHYRTNKNVKGLRHEHVIPRAIFNQSIESFRNEYIVNPNVPFDKDFCFNFLKEHITKKLFACIITRDEDKKFSGGLSRCMPDGQENFFAIEDPWARYKEADVTEVCKVEWIKVNKVWTPHIINENVISDFDSQEAQSLL